MTHAAVYEIANNRTDVTYIGSSADVRRRIYEHRRHLRRGDHYNIYLQRSWNVNGAAAFEFSVIESIADVSRLIEREQWHVDHARCRLFNTATVVDNPMMGQTHTAEARAKISAKLKGFVLSPEHKAALLAANLGSIKSPETRAKMRVKSTGHKHSPETLAKIGAASARRLHSVATRAQMSAAHKRRVRGPMSDTQRTAISVAKRLRWQEAQQ